MESSPSQRDRPPQILLGITGSVASIKGPELALSLARSLRAKVIVVLTSGGTNFWYKAKDYNETKWREYCQCMACDEGDHERVTSARPRSNSGTVGDGGKTFEKTVFSMLAKQVVEEADNGDNIAHFDFTGEIAICHAQDEWDQWNKIGDPVLHIQLRDWADMVIIAPLSAHTLAKIANGLCDDTLSCILRAWDYGYAPCSNHDYSDDNMVKKIMRKKPIIIAPAMNTKMWEHPLTKQQLDVMKGFWSIKKNDSENNPNKSGHEFSCWTFIVEPQVKTLACGDVGAGAMANVADIVNTAKKCLDGYMDDHQSM